MDRPVSRPNCERVASTIEFPVDLVLPKIARRRHRHFEVDMSIAGAKIDVRS